MLPNIRAFKCLTTNKIFGTDFRQNLMRKDMNRVGGALTGLGPVSVFKHKGALLGVRLENGNYPTLRLLFVQFGIDFA